MFKRWYSGLGNGNIFYINKDTIGLESSVCSTVALFYTTIWGEVLLLAMNDAMGDIWALRQRNALFHYASYSDNGSKLTTFLFHMS